MMQMLCISRAETHPFQGYDPCEVAYHFCGDVAIVIETLAKYIQTTSTFSAKETSNLKNRVTDLENDLKVVLGLEPEVLVGDSIGTLLNRIIIAGRKLQTSSESSRRLATLIEDLIKDIENLLRNLTGPELDRTMIPEIELKIWSQEEQFNSLINKSGEEVMHKSRPASDLLMPLLDGIGRTISEVLSLLGLKSCFRMPQEVTSPAPPVQKTSINIAKAHSPITSSNDGTGIASLTPYLLGTRLFPSNFAFEKPLRTTHAGKYVCTFHAYGCKSIFESKIVWKVHINVQHMRLETWRCDFDHGAIQPPPIPMPLPALPETQVENVVASGMGKRKISSSRITKALEPTTPQPEQEQDSDSDWNSPGKKGSRKRSKTDYFPQPEAPPSASSSLTHLEMPEPSYHEF